MTDTYGPSTTIVAYGGGQGVPGARGVTGAAGVDAVLKVTSTAAVEAYAVHADTATPGHVKAATANLATVRFVGVYTATALSGTTQAIQHAGPVDPAVHTAGTGVACAAGVKATGQPCRVTDVLCVSGLNFLGWYDTAGTLFIAPRLAEVFNILDFGAMPSDSGATARAANTNAFKAIQTLLGADPVYPFQPFGGIIEVPPLDFYLAADLSDSTVCINVTHPLSIRGHGARYKHTSRLLAPDGVTCIRFNHSGAAGSSVDGVYFQGEGVTTPTAYGLETLTAVRLSGCVFENFGGHGIYGNGSGFPDFCQVAWTYIKGCLDGVHIGSGDDTNGWLLDHVDTQVNRGWGVYDHSFLGATKHVCSYAENMRGPLNCLSTAGGLSTGAYIEADQPPSVLGGASQFFLGGTNGAGFTPNSNYFGGEAGSSMHSATFRAKANATGIVATGAAPEQVTLGGALTAATINLRIEVTTAGYPGGKDSFHANHTALVIRYSLDGGSTWTSNVSPQRADDGYNYGLSTVALGASGLTAYFVPYLYPIDSVYTATGTGGKPVSFEAGSSDGTLSVFGWTHAGTTPTEDPAPWRMNYDSALGLWRWKWANSTSYCGFSFVGGRSRPGPGELVHTSSLWLGREYDGWFRIAKANGDYAVGSSTWRSTTLALNQCYETGQIVFNTGATTRFPAAWRAKQRGGWANTAYGQDTLWSAGISITTGTSIRPSTPNGYVYQCKTQTGVGGSGITGGVEPTWPTTPGQTVADGAIMWECFGTEGSPFESLTAVESYTPTSSADAHGTTGDTAQDASYFYWKSASGWRRTAGGTF